jgi:predicted O-methyltransferase YrrM
MSLARKVRAVASLVPFWIKASSNGALITPESLLSFAYKCPGIHPMQVRSEFLEFAYIVQGRKPKAFLEIGTRNGGMFFVLCRLSDPQAIVISLDLPGGKFGGGYTAFQIPVMWRMKKTGQQLHLLRTDSHRAETKTRTQRALNGSQLDLLFIDGDHTYEGVRKDFEMYSPLVRPGGLIAFHDIVEIAEPDFGVPKFWNEVKTRYTHTELVENPRQGWGGLGLLYL